MKLTVTHSNTTTIAIYKTASGLYKIGSSGGRISLIQSVSENEHISGGNNPSELTDMAFVQLQEYFSKQRKIFDLPLLLEGTDFQKRVWTELCRIPYGSTRTYKQVATAIGNSKAARAVGMACNRNPIAIVIPCHRVTGSSGSLTGYAGGLALKAKLLDLEKD